MAPSTSTRYDPVEWATLEILPSFIYVIAAIMGAYFVHKLEGHTPRSNNSQNRSSIFSHFRDRMVLIMLNAPYAAFSLSLIFASDPFNLDTGGSIKNKLLWACVIAIVMFAGMRVAIEYDKLQKQMNISSQPRSYTEEEIDVLTNHSRSISESSVLEGIGLIVAAAFISWIFWQS